MFRSLQSYAAVLVMSAVLATVPSGAYAQMTGIAIDRIPCETSEGAVLHLHQHLTIIDRGHRVTVPANIGIVPMLGCLYWIHTHTSDGFIHIEAPVQHRFTLGEFFDVWGRTLHADQAANVRAPRRGQLRFWVNGRLYGRNPRTIALGAHTDVVVEAGPPFVAPPRTRDWHGL